MPVQIFNGNAYFAIPMPVIDFPQLLTVRFLDVSFASKHLRFLRPDICPVFDSYLHDALPYTLDASGYSDFANDCAWLAHQLGANQIPNPRQRAGGVWFAADVEGAIYMLATR